MKLSLTFNLGNAAYEPPNGDAIADTVRSVAGAIADAHDLGPGDGGTVRDINGNTVGNWSIKR